LREQQGSDDEEGANTNKTKYKVRENTIYFVINRGVSKNN